MSNGIKQRIASLLSAKSMTGAELADAIGVNRQAVYDLTSGKRPAKALTRKVAAFLGVSVEFLTSGKHEQDSGLSVCQTTADTVRELSALVRELTAEVRALRAERPAHAASPAEIQFP